MTGIIVLCRYNSSRLPGKILKSINGKVILAYILERLALIQNDYPIVVCTSKEKSDDPIAEFCQNYGVSIFRGELNNVAKRFLDCAKNFGFDNAVRINGDNLFTDSQLIKMMIKEMELHNRNFVSNVKGRTFPSGLSVEIVNVRFYESMYDNFEDHDLEHVMTYFYKIGDKNFKFIKNKKIVGANINLAVDTEQDLKNASKIINLMKTKHTGYDYQKILALYKKMETDE